VLISVRRATASELRRARKRALREDASLPPAPGRAVSKEMRHGGARLVFYLAVLAGVLAGISVAGPASAGIPAATASSLDVLWQVQAASVGLVVTLMVFVFGLLPARSRGC
jgi:hypothetical protein